MDPSTDLPTLFGLCLLTNATGSRLTSYMLNSDRLGVADIETETIDIINENYDIMMRLKRFQKANKEKAKT